MLTQDACSTGLLVLSHLEHACGRIMLTFSTKLVMFPEFEFQLFLGTSVFTWNVVKLVTDVKFRKYRSQPI